jgi:hypothetical protein
LQLLIIFLNVLMLAYMVYYIRNKFRRVENSANVPHSLGSGDAKLIRKLLSLTGSFIVMTFPLLLILNLAYVRSWEHSFQYVVFVCFIICMLNSALNPIVYIWRFREPRFQLQFLLCFFSSSFTDKIRQRRNQCFAEFQMQAFPRSNRTHEQGQNNIIVNHIRDMVMD